MTTPNANTLRLGDRIEFNGTAYVFAALNGAVAELRAGNEAPVSILMTALLTDRSFKLLAVVGRRRPGLGESAIFQTLPASVKVRAYRLEGHITEVLDGVPAGAVAGTRPRRDYDVTSRSLQQRLLAKGDELQTLGEPLSLSTLGTGGASLILRYKMQGKGEYPEQKISPLGVRGSATGLASSGHG